MRFKKIILFELLILFGFLSSCNVSTTVTSTTQLDGMQEKHQIKYTLNGGINNVNNPEFFISDTKDIYLENPTNEDGLIFDGWYTSFDFIESTKISCISSDTHRNVFLFAKWVSCKIESAPDFDISYDLDYPIISTTVSNKKDSMLLSNVISVSKDCNWILSKDIEGSNTISTKNMSLQPGHNKAYITVWYEQKYNTVYVLDIYRLKQNEYSFISDNVIVSTGSIDEKGKVEYLAISKDGYTFDGWMVDEVIVSFPYEIKESTKFVAKYSPNKYIISLNSNEDELDVTEIEIEYNSCYSLPIPKHTGYTFIGWYLKDEKVTDESGNSITTFNYIDNIELVAKWEVTKYSILYICNGINPNTIDTYTIEDEIILKEPELSGYTFIGWYSGDNYQDEIKEIKNDTGNLILFAKFEENNYEIEYFLKEDEALPENYGNKCIIQSGKTVSDIPIPIKEGYTFSGWYTGESINDTQFTVLSIVTQNMILYARWDINSYALNVDVDQDSIDYGYANSNSTKYEFNSDVTIIATTQPNCTFDGWYEGECLFSDKSDYTFKMPSKDLSLTAKFSNVPMEKTSVIEVSSIADWKEYCESMDYSFDDNHHNRYLFKCTFIVSSLANYTTGNLYNEVSKKSVGCGIILKDSNGEYIYASSIWLDEIPWEWNSTYGYYISDEYPKESTGFNTDDRTKNIKVGDSITLVVSLSHSSFNGFTVETGKKGSGNFAWCVFVNE